MIWEHLPFKGRANTWGDEIYFEIGVKTEKEPNGRTNVEVGELCYWLLGRAFCIFSGPAPASRDEKPRSYRSVNILGRVIGEEDLFRLVDEGIDSYQEGQSRIIFNTLTGCK